MSERRHVGRLECVRLTRKQLSLSTMIGNRGQPLQNQTMESNDHPARDNELYPESAQGGATEVSETGDMVCLRTCSWIPAMGRKSLLIVSSLF